MHIGDRLEQNFPNLTVQSLNIGQIFCKHLVNIEALDKYWTNVVQILGIYYAIVGQILCKYCEHIMGIL